MINSLATSSTPPATTVSQPQTNAYAEPAKDTGAQTQAASAKPQPQSDVRLMIEQNKDAPGFVYKLVDSLTGATLAEIPRQTDETPAPDGYVAGQMVRATA